MKTLKILALSLFVSLVAFACEEENVVPNEGIIELPVHGPTETPPEFY